MSAENVRDIREILESIESLKKQADHSQDMHEHQDNTPNQDRLPTSLVAELAVRKADVVLLDDVHRKGISQQERKSASPTKTADQKTKIRLAPGFKTTPSDAEFDQMLSTLMKDMEHQSEKTGTSREPKTSAISHSATPDPKELTNLEADIDSLLSPYLNPSKVTSNPQPTPAPESIHVQRAEKQEESQQRIAQKDSANDKHLSAIITDEMRAEIADFILAEIKQQISGWIAENLDNIVEEALRSATTGARDSLKARSVR